MHFDHQEKAKTMNQELYQHILEMQHASYFRAAADDGTAHIVDSPFLGGPTASAFERIGRFDDPVLEIARLGTHEVHAVCWGIDAVQDSLDSRANVKPWTMEGAIAVRHMAGGRC